MNSLSIFLVPSRSSNTSSESICTHPPFVVAFAFAYLLSLKCNEPQLLLLLFSLLDSQLNPSKSLGVHQSHSSSRAKTLHSVSPILPSCNYYGNLAHKASECNNPFEDLFCDYCGKKGHREAICFAKFSGWKQLQ